MATREEILRELNLAPTWRRRAEPGRDRRSFGGHDHGTTRDELARRAAVIGHARDRPLDADARRSRIQALEWNAFAADVDACTACGLCRTRNRSVPGVGDARAEWMFIGEAPGAEEDARGEPFVGQAGRLLDNMLAALGHEPAERTSTSRTC